MKHRNAVKYTHSESILESKCNLALTPQFGLESRLVMKNTEHRDPTGMFDTAATTFRVHW